LISSSSMHSYFSLGFLSYCIPHHRLLHSFPTRRSSDLTARIPSAPPLLDAHPLPGVVAAAAAGADAAGRPGASRGVAVLRPGQVARVHDPRGSGTIAVVAGGRVGGDDPPVRQPAGVGGVGHGAALVAGDLSGCDERVMLLVVSGAHWPPPVTSADV